MLALSVERIMVIIKVEGMYDMTHSSFRYTPGLLNWKSTDLQNWTPVTYALYCAGEGRAIFRAFKVGSLK
jgi:beta-xylosidase